MVNGAFEYDAVDSARAARGNTKGGSSDESSSESQPEDGVGGILLTVLLPTRFSHVLSNSVGTGVRVAKRYLIAY